MLFVLLAAFHREIALVNNTLSINKVTWIQRNNPRTGGLCYGKVSGTGCVDQFAQVKDLVAVKACGSIHGGLSFI